MELPEPNPIITKNYAFTDPQLAQQQTGASGQLLSHQRINQGVMQKQKN